MYIHSFPLDKPAIPMEELSPDGSVKFYFWESNGLITGMGKSIRQEWIASAEDSIWVLACLKC